jgi:Kelch motif
MVKSHPKHCTRSVILTTRSRFTQNTTGDIPPQLTLFCSVVAAAADGSSYNIYIYGGYDGNASDTPSNDVYILSVPSFTWTQGFAGNSTQGRIGHKCVKVYPDQMFIIGGVYQGGPEQCLQGGFIQIFNLNTLQFQDSYSPIVWHEYQVPSLVTAQIGGK